MMLSQTCWINSNWSATGQIWTACSAVGMSTASSPGQTAIERPAQCSKGVDLAEGMDKGRGRQQTPARRGRRREHGWSPSALSNRGIEDGVHVIVVARAVGDGDRLPDGVGGAGRLVH